MEQPAVDAVFSVAASVSPTALVPVLAFKTNDFQVSHTDEDVSTKGSAQERERYPQGSQHDMQISGDFVADDSDAAFDLLKQAALSKTNPSIYGRFQDGADTYTGTWQITQFSLSAPEFGAVKGSITLMQVSAITVATQA